MTTKITSLTIRVNVLASSCCRLVAALSEACDALYHEVSRRLFLFCECKIESSTRSLLCVTTDMSWYTSVCSDCGLFGNFPHKKNIVTIYIKNKRKLQTTDKVNNQLKINNYYSNDKKQSKTKQKQNKTKQHFLFCSLTFVKNVLQCHGRRIKRSSCFHFW